MKKALSLVLLVVGWGLLFLAVRAAHSHSGIVDGYGCHRDPKTERYHCHQGQFIGQSFKSKEEFLKKLRGGSSDLPMPKQTPPVIERKDRENGNSAR